LEIGLKDIFSASEYSFMIPIFGFKTYQKFVKSNQWLKKYKPNWILGEAVNLKLISDSWFSKPMRKIKERIWAFDFIEKWLESWQIPRIMNDPRTQKKGSMIIANNEALIFLPEPQSPKIYDLFRNKLDKIARA